VVLGIACGLFQAFDDELGRGQIRVSDAESDQLSTLLDLLLLDLVDPCKEVGR